MSQEREDTPPEHPTPLRLEAWHAGEADAEVEAHVASCEGCRAYVGGLVAARKRFLEDRDPEAAVRALRTAADHREAATTASRAGPFPRWFWVAVAGATAVALAVVALGTLRPELGAPAGMHRDRGRLASPANAIRLKGGWLQLAVIRLRAGRQTLHRGPTLSVTGGDRLRIALTVGTAARVSAGLLEDDGRWTPLQDGRLEVGEHPLGEGVTIDDQGPTAAWLLAGSPAAVKRARITRLLRGVARLRIEGKPR